MSIEDMTGYKTVRVNGYTGLVKHDGHIGVLPSAPVGDGFLPDAAQLRRYAEFIIALAQASECLIGNLESEKGIIA